MSSFQTINLKKHISNAFVFFIIATILLGMIYPLFITLIGQNFFPYQSNGSQIKSGSNIVGSELIGQPFDDPKYFWGRISLTQGFSYNASLSTGSNFAPSNPQLISMVQQRIADLKAYDPNNTAPIPVDLVTASASGLDPDISVAAAYYQAGRVAKYQNISVQIIDQLIVKYTQLGNLLIFGERIVNVLKINLELKNGIDYNSLPKDNSKILQYSFLGNHILYSINIRTIDLIQIFTYFIILLLLSIPLGKLMAKLFIDNEDSKSDSIKSYLFLSNSFIKLKFSEEMDWKNYFASFMILSFIGILFVILLQEFQASLPLNPNKIPNVKLDLAFNTAISFASNTNWQSYSGEVTLSYLTQMLGLTVQNFLSAATGMAILLAVIRGLKRHTTTYLGNFWEDMIKSLLILVPLSILFSIFLISQGVVQSFNGGILVNLVDPVRTTSGIITKQFIPLGPVASQEAIKMLGTNGGGFFGTNSAHPFENPTALTNFAEMIAILLIPASLCITYGELIGDKKQGYGLYLVMLIILIIGFSIVLLSEINGNPELSKLGINQISSWISPGGNMEGKEVRFGIVNSSLFASLTTAASNGAVNSMLDSFMPLSGIVLILFMTSGEVIFGGVGSGLYGMLIFILLANFIGSLMIGRSPSYMNKKIDADDMKLISFLVLLPITICIVGVFLMFSLFPSSLGMENPGPHGITEVLYAFASATFNNGSAFAGLSTNSLIYNVLLAIEMFIGRFVVAGLTLKLIDNFSRKRKNVAQKETLNSHSPIFFILLISTIMLLGLLSFIPILLLGPVAEFFSLINIIV